LSVCHFHFSFLFLYLLTSSWLAYQFNVFSNTDEFPKNSPIYRFYLIWLFDFNSNSFLSFTYFSQLRFL
jgi:hypothetical protein